MMPYPSVWEALSGLGLFILGMKLMSEGLQKLAGDKIRRILEKMTGTRISSALFGSSLSASLQSSSSAAILVIGFTNAGLLSLYQALAVMLGTGLGTFDPAFRLYQPAGVTGRFDHAHNDWLETVMSFGVLGSIPIGAGLLLCLAHPFAGRGAPVHRRPSRLRSTSAAGRGAASTSERADDVPSARESR